MIMSGDIVTFQIKIRNVGYSNALGCRIVIDIPEGIEYYSYSTVTGEYIPETNTWQIGGIQPGEEKILNYSVRVVSDCNLPAFISWEAFTDSLEDSLLNNTGSYQITDSCCALRHCLEFLKYKHVWVDYQKANANEAKLENILKPFTSVESAISEINALGTLSEQSGWQFHISGEVEEIISFEEIKGETVIEFENFKTNKSLYFNDIGSQILIKGTINKKEEGELFVFSSSVNLETVNLDMVIFRDTNYATAKQNNVSEPLGEVWIKSLIIQSNEPFGLPVNGSPIIFKSL